MDIRKVVGKRLRSVIGPQRVESLVRTERRVRQATADAVAPRPVPSESVTPQRGAPAESPVDDGTGLEPGFVPSDPFVDFPEPQMSRHELLEGLHRVLRPRTYLEIGVNDGLSLRLSRTKSIGVDPFFSITQQIECDVRLVRSKSDDFFASADAFASFGGTPVDLAFIDGMHLSEYALRDFINTERHMALTGVVVLDDMLPRNPREAARERSTRFWAGDVFKVAEILRRHRPDLLVVEVNTSPTGVVVVVGPDPASAVLSAVYQTELGFCESPDPQDPPQAIMSRSRSVSPVDLLALPQWADLITQRDQDPVNLDDLRGALLSLPTAS